jgi:hypothetical protein
MVKLVGCMLLLIAALTAEVIPARAKMCNSAICRQGSHHPYYNYFHGHRYFYSSVGIIPAISPPATKSDTRCAQLTSAQRASTEGCH